MVERLLRQPDTAPPPASLPWLYAATAGLEAALPFPALACRAPKRAICPKAFPPPLLGDGGA